MQQKTLLIIDDEIGYAGGLIDALEYDGFRVLTATTAQEALSILKKERIDMATVDIMMPPGPSLEGLAPSDRTGVILCRTLRTKYPQLPLICISVITNRDTIHEIEKMNIRFLRKGEVPLRTILDYINTKLFGRSFGPSN